MCEALREIAREINKEAYEKEMQDAINLAVAEKDECIAEKDECIAEKNARIAELEAELAQMKKFL